MKIYYNIYIYGEQFEKTRATENVNEYKDIEEWVRDIMQDERFSGLSIPHRVQAQETNGTIKERPTETFTWTIQLFKEKDNRGKKLENNNIEIRVKQIKDNNEEIVFSDGEYTKEKKIQTSDILDICDNLYKSRI